MARVVFLGTPAHGHVNPTRAVVRALVSRGEELTYFCGEEFRAKIEPCGAVFESYESLTTEAYSYESREIGNLCTLASMILDRSRVLLPPLMERIRVIQPEYIIHDAVSAWGKTAAALLDVPAVCSVTSLAFKLRVGMHSQALSWEMIWMLLEDGAGLWRARRDAVKIGGEWGRKAPGILDALTNEEGLNIVYTSKFFQPRSDIFGDSYHFVGPSVFEEPEEDDLPWDMIGDGPLVYVSMGTIFHETLPLYHSCFTALGDSDCKVILSIGSKTSLESLGRVPENFIVRHHVPQLRVLKRADVFVSHGGMNSVSESLLHGVPLVLIPQGADQFVVAERVQKLGAGVQLHRNRVDATVLRNAVQKVLSDGTFKSNCERVADSFHEAGGPERAAEDIMRYVRESKRLRAES